MNDGGRNILLTYNAYTENISLRLIDMFNKNGIIAYALPAHSSGKTEPLNFVLFIAFKQALRIAIAQTVNPGSLEI